MDHKSSPKRATGVSLQAGLVDYLRSFSGQTELKKTALQIIVNQMNDTQRKALIGTPICSLDASLHLNAKIEVLEQGRPLTMSPNVEPQARPMLWRRIQESMGRADLGGRMPLVSGKSRHCVPQIQEQRCPDLRAPCPQAAGPEDA